MWNHNRLISYLLLATNLLLLFFLIFEENLVLGKIFAVLGRMHPLFLHLPIGFLVVVALSYFWKDKLPKDFFQFFLGLTALFTSVTAIMGLFLSQEGGYENSSQLDWHKYSGVGLSLLLWFLYGRANFKFAGLGFGAALCLVFFSGHLGGSITHGEDFLFEPFLDTKKVKDITLEDNFYEAKIFPILEAKCVSCHNDQKTKGELNMSSLTKLAKGGENGPLWLAGDALNSHLLIRANLPLDDKEHMPPKAKPQLTPEEIRLLYLWIESGADTQKTLAEYQKEEELFALVNFEKKSSEKTYAFSSVGEKVLEEVNTSFCTVEPIAYGTAALKATFFVSKKYDTKVLQNLEKVSEQLVELNLNKMPIRPEDLRIIGAFPNLEKLYMNGCELDGTGLEALKSLKKLEHLSIANNPLKAGSLDVLKELQSISSLYIWAVPSIQKTDLAFLKNVSITEGYDPTEDDLTPLNPPQVVNEGRVLKGKDKIQLKHALPSVQIKYAFGIEEVDSLNSPVYSQPLDAHGFVRINAKAYGEGWLSSSSIPFTFFTSKFLSDSAKLLSSPDRQYPGKLAKSLIDGVAGDENNFKDGNWLGYKENAGEFIVRNKAKEGITISYLEDPGSYIMAPKRIELWGSKDGKIFTPIPVTSIPQTKAYKRKEVLGINVPLGQKYTWLKFRVSPVAPLPAWHQGKGQKGWAFIDEIYFW